MKKEWVGNPAKSVAVEDMLDACKNKDGKGEWRHSRAMSFEDMQKLHNNYLKNCPVIDASCDHLNSEEQLEGEDIQKLKK